MLESRRKAITPFVVPERAIQARTGHKSVEALRTYERVSSTLEQSMCSVLGDVSNQPGIVSTRQTKSVVQLPTVCYNFTCCSVNIYNAPVQTTPVRPDSERISEEEFTEFENF